MIAINVIDKFFDKAAVSLGIEFERANQDAAGDERENYPYGTYQLLTETQRSKREYEKERQSTAGDLVEITTSKRSVGVISVNFVDKLYIDNPQSLVRDFINFVDSRIYRDRQNATYYDADFENLDMDITNPSGEDRTIFIGDVQYEYKYGVDINFKYNDQVVETVENIKTMVIENQNTGDDITINKPT